MSELNIETFDLVSVLSGQEAPESTVDVFFNEKLGFTISELNKLIAQAERAGDDKLVKKLSKELDVLLATVPEHKFTVHLRGVDERVRKSISATVDKQFPPKKDLIGRVEDNPEADELLAQLWWEAHIVKVVDPSGKVAVGSPETVAVLLDKAPRTAQNAISSAITALSEDVKAGFEFASKELGFL